MKTNEIHPDYVSPEINVMTISVEKGFAASETETGTLLPYSPEVPDYEDGIYF